MPLKNLVSCLLEFSPMPSKKILLVHEDASLRSDLEQSLQTKDSIVSLPTTARAKRKIGHQPFAFVVIEAREDWYRNIQRLYRLNGKIKNATILVAPTSLLKNHSDSLRSLSVAALGHAHPGRAVKGPILPAEELRLKDFVEHKLRHFVQNMKISGVRNLYSMLLAEVERPMITYVLKETNGNQV